MRWRRAIPSISCTAYMRFECPTVYLTFKPSSSGLVPVIYILYLSGLFLNSWLWNSSISLSTASEKTQFSIWQHQPQNTTTWRPSATMLQTNHVILKKTDDIRVRTGLPLDILSGESRISLVKIDRKTIYQVCHRHLLFAPIQMN